MDDASSNKILQLNTPEAIAPSAEAPTQTIGFASARSETVDDRLGRDARYLINEAFHEPPNVIAYYISQRLAELFPEKALVETSAWAFDPVRYASAGHCRLAMRNRPYPHRVVSWKEGGKRLGKTKSYLQQGWFEIEWESEHIEILMMHWADDRRTVRHCFMLADSGETAIRFLQTVCDWQSTPRAELYVFEEDEWRKDKKLYEAIQSVTLDSLVLPDGMKEEIVADVTGFFDARATYERFGVPWKRGILLVGPPGNGKTHAVKGLINALGQKCLYVKSFRHGGPDEYAISSVFDKARRTAPCVLVLEDLDSLVTDRNRSFFLNELDGFAGNDGILVLATTNHPERLDAAIVDRPSRFDRKYHFTLPDLDERTSYIARWNSGIEPAMQVRPATVREIAEFADGFSYAYLKELCLAAVMAWIRTPEPDAMEEIIRMQVENLRRQMSSRQARR